MVQLSRETKVFQVWNVIMGVELSVKENDRYEVNEDGARWRSVTRVRSARIKASLLKVYY